MSLVKFAVLFTMYTQAQSEAPVTLPQLELPPISQRGRASWYGNGALHGAITANGERLDPEDQTCAHRTLPFDTMILIENPRSGLRAWCRVNDRGPYGALDAEGQWQIVVSSDPQVAHRGILDMTIATARALATTASGIQHVYLRYWQPAQPALFNLAAWTP